jgi:hypothetical protein
VTKALIYLRESDPELYARCHEHCETSGYDVIGVILDPEGTRWPGAGAAAVIVVARPTDVPSDRLPRTELADGGQPTVPVAVTPRRRRPRFRR